MKKVSDLYCYRHDSEACGCREQLALPMSRDVRVAPDWFVENLNRFVCAIAKYSGVSAEHTCLEVSKRLGEKLGVPAGEYVMLSTAAGLLRVKVRTE